MKTTLLVPVLNEIEAMKQIMPRIKREWIDQIVIVDGGSSDGTLEYARAKGYFVYVQKKPGIREAFIEALPYIEGDIVITFSPDGNSIPESIPALIDKMKEGYDMVIASRYLGKAKSYDDDLITGFGNWLFTKTINLLFKAHYTDALVIFRAYRKRLIYDLELDKKDGFEFAEKLFHCREGEFGWEPLLSVRAAKRRLKVGEIPADEPARIGGERKLRVLNWGGAIYFQFLRERFFWR
jgi:glycosyltransferase involved in cell wall biosynthesis